MPTTIDASFIDSLPPNVAVQFLERVAKSAHREAFRYPEGPARQLHDATDALARRAAGSLRGTASGTQVLRPSADGMVS